MRRARWKGTAEAALAHYHCVSRVVDRRFALGEAEKEQFMKLMRGCEAFCGVRVVTYCIMDNHFHALVEVPRRPPPESLPDACELVRRVCKARSSYGAEELKQNLA